MNTQTIRAALVLISAATTATVLAAPASADTMTRESLSWPTTDEVVATCESGAEIGLGFDLTRIVHDKYDRSGVLTRQIRNVNYTGIFENLATGERYTFRGTRIVTFDFVDRTFTSRGNYRTVTMPGAGTVLHTAGIYVEDLDVEGLFYHQGGPVFDEWSDGGAAAVCSLFGLAVEQS
jgi:hypothetical protein